jgi:hypothetical protein
MGEMIGGGDGAPEAVAMDRDRSPLPPTSSHSVCSVTYVPKSITDGYVKCVFLIGKHQNNVGTLYFRFR